MSTTLADTYAEHHRYGWHDHSIVTTCAACIVAATDNH